MKKLEKSEIYGLIGTIIFGILLLFILIFCSLSYRIFHEEPEGLSVNFGDQMEAEGLYEPAPASVLETIAATPPPKVSKPTPPASTPEVLQTQDLEESLAVKEAREKERERKKDELEKQRAEQRAEQERNKIEQQRVAEQKRVADEKAKQAAEKARQAAAIKAQAQGAFSGAGTSSSSTGEGTGKGAGNQGNPFGDNSTNRIGSGTGTGSGSSFKLGNRRTMGALSQPSDNTQVSGKIVVDITVNANGDVIEAEIGQGTNIAEATARNAALSAARKTKFSKGDKTEIGVITYNYKLD